MTSTRAHLSLFTSYFLISATNAILTPYMQLYLQARGFPPSQIGLLLGCYNIMGVVGPMIFGPLADRHSTYRVLLALSVVTPILLFIPMQLTAHFALFFLCIGGMGLAFASANPLLDSLAGNVLADPDREYGKLRIAGSLGFIAISVFLQLTGLISGDSPSSIFIAFIAVSACAALSIGYLPAAPRAHEQESAARKGGDGFDPAFWAVIAVIFIGRFGMSAYYSFFSLYLKETYAISNVSAIWAIGPVAEIATIFFSGALIERLGIRRLLLISLAAITIRFGLYGFVRSLPVVVCAQLLHAFTFGTFHTASVAFINSKIKGSRRGLGMAIYNAVAVGLANFLASAAGGYLVEARGFQSLFLTYGAIPLLGILILAVFGKRLLPEKSRVR